MNRGGMRAVYAIVVACVLLPGTAAPQSRVHLRDEAEVRAAVLRWNGIAIDASGLDHTPPGPGETRRHGEQLGPGRSSRAMAIVHIAMFEAINAVYGGYDSYVGLEKVRSGLNVSAAIAQASHDALIAMFPSQASRFDRFLQDDLAPIPSGQARDQGIELGRSAAAAIVTKRADDGAAHAEPLIGVDYFPSLDPGHWRADPVTLGPAALGAHWSRVKPFVLDHASQFRVPPPPPMESAAYAAAFEEVRALGGDGVVTPTIRTEDETMIGIYWAYDGLPSLCAPPRLYNQVALAVAERMQSPALEVARMLVLVNLALADSALAIWESKYFYDVWRPVTGIREADPGTGPTGAGDGNPATRGDPQFMPLGAPASNLAGPNFTPPFPAYPSGHAGFGGALFQVLRRIYGRDDIDFTFVSDELNGRTLDNLGAPRPLRPRHYSSLSQAEEENGQSRIFLGIHWAFDKTSGIAQGREVADFIVDQIYRPRSPR